MNNVRDGDPYFEWLTGYVKVGRDDSVIKLLKMLHEFKFTWSVNNDVNRDFDGLKIRREYYGEDAPDYILKSPCSVLEMLIGFSKRISQDVLGDDSPEMDGIKKWFWIMLENIGLVDSKRKNIKTEEEDKQIIEKWLSRGFDKNGNGSPFPLIDNDSSLDQRKIELWQQLSLYLAEHPELEE